MAKKKKKSKMGVYIMRSLSTGKRYIGRSLDVSSRIRQHRFALRHGRSDPLRHECDLYGYEDIEIEVMDLVANEADLEYAYRDRLKSEQPELNSLEVPPELKFHVQVMVWAYKDGFISLEKFKANSNKLLKNY